MFFFSFTVPLTLDTGASSQKPILRATAQDFSSTDIFIVERDGEMPSNVKPSTVIAANASSDLASSTAGGSLPKFARLSSFTPYETPDEPRTSTPEPIKVVRSKKKTTGKKDKKDKKKQSATTASGALI